MAAILRRRSLRGTSADGSRNAARRSIDDVSENASGASEVGPADDERCNDMLILNGIADARGWSPIQHMIVLAAELLGAEVLTIEERGPGRCAQALSVVRGRTRADSGEPCLLVCPGPG